MNTSNNTTRFDTEMSIVLAGQAGQGIQAIDFLLTRILRKAGYHVFSTSEFMSRIRGGSNSTEIRVTAKHTAAYVDKIDIFIPLDALAITHCEKRITPKTLILGEKEKLATQFSIIEMPFGKTAESIGGKLYANSVAVGAVAGILAVDKNDIAGFFQAYFALKGQDVIDKNVAAAMAGFALGETLVKSQNMAITIPRDPDVQKEFFMNGALAVSLGALAGGCDFVSSYPMSPGTTVLECLAEYKHKFDIVVEQAEDEIAAVNMAIGAWYTGARGFVTTAGGGFALMCEAISLSGIVETPVVVHVGMRPGPGTGLPTRTEQSDLELVLYAGHGEFPRAIFAPGTLQQAIDTTQKAFELADQYQIPVFVLTDQFFLDSYAATPPVDMTKFSVYKRIVKTEADYKRYLLSTENGISPRGIPGYGNGIVCVDSDEHTEQGYITESGDVRIAMADKRMKKADGILSEALPPVFIGNELYDTLVMCWGSNFACVKEALEKIGDKNIAMLHFLQVYPICKTAEMQMRKAKKLIMVENNSTGQFAKLIKLSFGVELKKENMILKYDGAPFSVESLILKIKEI